MTRFLIFANGDLNPGVAVAATLAQPAQVIAADGGAHLAIQCQQPIHTVIGDMDSIAPALLTELASAGSTILRFPREKNETDLELALLEAAQQGATWIGIIGALGGRLDQQLANIYLLALPMLRSIEVCLAAGNQTARLLAAGRHSFIGNPGDTLSLIPLAGPAQGVTTWGLQYPLQDDTLAFGPARGISNVIQAQEAGVSIAQGTLLVVQTTGTA